MDLATLTALLGWSAVINTGLLLFSTVMVLALRRPIARLHAHWFGLEEKDIGQMYFRFLAQYKLAIILLNITPYLAAKIIA